MTKSDSIKELSPALVKAQSEFPAIAKTKKVLVKSDKGSYEFMYAPLDEIVAAIRPVLAENSLAFSQGVSGDFLVTTVLHTSGEFISDSMPIKGGGTTQAYGGELTYKRRYGLTSMLGLVTEDDDDAGRTETEVTKKKSTKVAAEFYDALPAEKQVEFKNKAKAVETEFYTKGIRAAIARYDADKATLDGDEITAYWNCLDSKVRSSIKEYGKAHPVPAALLKEPAGA
jgi:hypothetical protein